MNKPSAQRARGAVLYTRVSTGEQDKHGTSPETQRDACRAKAQALGLPIIAEYYDGGVSRGFLLTRPGMQAALAAVQAGRADTLICANISRYSRDTEHQQAIKKAVRAAGGRLVFCDMEFADTPEGDLNFTIQGGFAQYEKDVIKKRTDGGRIKRAKGGVQPSRRTSPYGYHIVTHADVIRGEYGPADLGRYFLRDDQARVARRIWADYHAGAASLAGLARQLTLEGVPTPGASRQWSMTTVRYLLLNPVYKGVAVYGRFDNTTDEGRLMESHWRTGEPLKEPRRRCKADPSTWITMSCPALVTEEVWDAVQIRLSENKAKKGGNPQRVRMLAGRVLCPHCGGALVCGSTKRRNRQGESEPAPQRYSCGRYTKTVAAPGGPECQPTGYLVADVEQAPVAALLDAARRPEALAAAARAYAQPERPDAADARRELAALDGALGKLGREEAATVQAQIQGVMQGAPPDAYAAAFADLAARRKDTEDRRGVLTRLVRAPRPGPATEGPALGPQALADAALVLTSPDVPGAVKRDAIACLIESVTPRRDGDGLETTVVFLAGALGAETVETVLMVLDGSEGSILVGGELPIPVVQSSSGTSGSSASVSITYKPYGVRLSVGAALVGEGMVEMTVTPEVSDLNYAATVQIGGSVVPSLTVRRATSTLLMADGETLVIGGLYSNTSSRQVERIPLLSQIPVLGEFFKHTVTRKEEDELLILIQPEIVTPLTAGAHPPAPGSLENPPIGRPFVRRGDFDKDFPELQRGGGDRDMPGPPINLPPLPVPLEPK